MVIADLEREVEELKKKLKVAENNLYAARLAEHGLEIGGIVLAKDGCKVKIRSVSFSFRRPWIRGYRMKKNGEWSTMVAHIYDDWSKP